LSIFLTTLTFVFIDLLYLNILIALSI
jgi:hypothetical protein